MQFCFAWARRYWQWKPRTKGTLIVIEAGYLLHFDIHRFLITHLTFSQIGWSLSCCPSIFFKIDRILIEISTNERPASYFSQPIRSSFAIGRQPFAITLQSTTCTVTQVLCKCNAIHNCNEDFQYWIGCILYISNPRSFYRLNLTMKISGSPSHLLHLNRRSHAECCIDHLIWLFSFWKASSS